MAREPLDVSPPCPPSINTPTPFAPRQELERLLIGIRTWPNPKPPAVLEAIEEVEGLSQESRPLIRKLTLLLDWRKYYNPRGKKLLTAQAREYAWLSVLEAAGCTVDLVRDRCRISTPIGANCGHWNRSETRHWIQLLHRGPLLAGLGNLTGGGLADRV